MPETADDERGTGSRWYQIVLVGAVGLALVGFFVGTRDSEYEEFRQKRVDGPESERDRAPERRADMQQAPTYRALMRSAFDKNKHTRRAVAKYGSQPPEQWRRTRGERSDNRAYDGAPPTVPHPVRQRTAEACAVCHQNGVRVEQRTGPPMSHEFKSQCLQCHAPSASHRGFARTPPDSVPTGNGFQGLEPPERGPRSYEGAPPRIPHRTRTRSNCQSCHGPFGRPGPMSHEAMTNCRQCHASSGGPPAVSPPMSVAPGNRFDGLETRDGAGRRAWEGAPTGVYDHRPASNLRPFATSPNRGGEP